MVRLLHPTTRALWRLTCIFLLLAVFFTSTAAAQTEQPQASPIIYGSITPGTIGVPGEVDAYTFTADAGDSLLIAVTRSSGSLWPRVRLYGPGGILLNDQRDTPRVEITYRTKQLYRLFLPLAQRSAGGSTSMDESHATGSERQDVASEASSYTILVSDGFDGTLTGGYNLYLQKLNPPAQATPLVYGQLIGGTLGQVGEMDAFTFSAEAGDKLLIGMSRVSGNLWQEIRLYSPAGDLLAENSSPTHAELSYTPAGAGIYSVLVTDGFDGTLTGSYNLFVQRTNNPGGATGIAFGQTLPGSIGLPAEMDAFTFSVEAGDKLLIGMSRVSGNLWQEIRLYSPAGDLVAENSSSTHTEVSYTAPSAGIYSVLVTDGFDGTLTGSYNLFVQRTNNPGGATGITPGQTLPGSIGQPAEKDAFTFSANAGEQFLITMTRVSGSVWPKLALYDPAGNLVFENSSSTQAQITQVLASSGTHAVLCSDGFNGTLTGSYSITLQKLP